MEKDEIKNPIYKLVKTTKWNIPPTSQTLDIIATSDWGLEDRNLTHKENRSNRKIFSNFKAKKSI